MFANLKAEMRRQNLTQDDVAACLGISACTVSQKLNERIPMTVAEVKSIQSQFFPNLTLDYLLGSDGDTASKREQKEHLADLAVDEAI